MAAAICAGVLVSLLFLSYIMSSGLLPEYGCRNTLIGNRPLCLREDFARLGVQTARLLFTTESPEECAHIARAFLSGAPLEGEFTRGLYKRGVE